MLQDRHVPFQLFIDGEPVCMAVRVDENKVPCVTRVRCECHGESNLALRSGRATLCSRSIRWSNVKYECDTDGSKRDATCLDDFMYDLPRRVEPSPTGGVAKMAMISATLPTKTPTNDMRATQKRVRDACQSLVDETDDLCRVFSELHGYLARAMRVMVPAFVAEEGVAHAMGCDRARYNDRFRIGERVTAIRVSENIAQPVLLTAHAEDGSRQEFAAGLTINKATHFPRRTSTNPPSIRRSCSAVPHP